MDNTKLNNMLPKVNKKVGPKVAPRKSKKSKKVGPKVAPRKSKKVGPKVAPRKSKKKKGIDCNLIISAFCKPKSQCITELPFIIPAEIGKRIKDISILSLLLNSHISINGLDKTKFIYISSGTQGSVWKFTDLDGSLKIVKIPNLQNFSGLFKTKFGKISIDDLNWKKSDIIKIFKSFSENEFTDFNSLNKKLSKIDMSKEKLKIKSSNTELRYGRFFYNKNILNIKLVIKEYIDGVAPTTTDIKEIKNILKDTSIHDIKKNNIIKKGNYFYLIDFLL